MATRNRRAMAVMLVALVTALLAVFSPWQRPATAQDAGECGGAGCHAARVAKIEGIQDAVYAKDLEVQGLLVESLAAIETARTTAGADQAKLRAAVVAHRSAHVRWENLVVSENSMGFHNTEVSQELGHVADYARSAIQAATQALPRAAGQHVVGTRLRREDRQRARVAIGHRPAACPSSKARMLASTVFAGTTSAMIFRQVSSVKGSSLEMAPSMTMLAALAFPACRARLVASTGRTLSQAAAIRSPTSAG